MILVNFRSAKKNTVSALLVACTSKHRHARDLRTFFVTAKVNRILANDHQHPSRCAILRRFAEAGTIIADRCSWLCDNFRDLPAHEDGTGRITGSLVYFQRSMAGPIILTPIVMGRSSVGTLGGVSVYQNNVFIRQYTRENNAAGGWHDNNVSL